jgi:hypothetical protein
LLEGVRPSTVLGRAWAAQERLPSSLDGGRDISEINSLSVSMAGNF